MPNKETREKLRKEWKKAKKRAEKLKPMLAVGIPVVVSVLRTLR